MLRYYISSYSINSVPLIHAGTHVNLYQVSKLYASVLVLFLSKDSKRELRVLAFAKLPVSTMTNQVTGLSPGGNLSLSDVLTA